MKGTTKSPPAVGLSEIFWSWIGSFIGIAAVAYVNYTIVDKTDLVMIIGSFGASAVRKSRILDTGMLLSPGGIGPVIMLVVALIVNNIPKNRRYPEFWL
ncbi:HPP family protein+B94 [Olavius sp. associated proteobacterium Delta 1]|nr:HPP family protein+B94 [Olavius sp. associated proteobacterium Delta 1]